jgi:hypothetical protein
MTDRPFKVLGVQQIAIGGLDIKALRRLWIDTLGLTPTINFRNNTENVHGEIAVVGFGPFRVDMNLLQPIDPEKGPRAHKPPLNHIGLWVDDIRAAADWLSAQGEGAPAGDQGKRYSRSKPGLAPQPTCRLSHSGTERRKPEWGNTGIDRSRLRSGVRCQYLLGPRVTRWCYVV